MAWIFIFIRLNFFYLLKLQLASNSFIINFISLNYKKLEWIFYFFFIFFTIIKYFFIFFIILYINFMIYPYFNFNYLHHRNWLIKDYFCYSEKSYYFILNFLECLIISCIMEIIKFNFIMKFNHFYSLFF